MRAKLTKKKKIVLSLSFLLILFGVSELALRVYWYAQSGGWDIRTYYDSDLTMYDSYPGMRYVLKPNAKEKARSKVILSNADGYRGDIVPVERTANSFRILCLGGSTTFSTGVDNYKDSWPEQLKDSLQKLYPNRSIELINAGVPGYNSYDSYLNFKLRFRKYKPDLVIVYHGINDIQTVLRPKYAGDYSHRKTMKFGTDKFSGLNALAHHSMFFLKMKKTVGDILPKNRSLANDDTPPSDEANRKVAPHLTDHLGKIIELCKEDGIQCMISTFATPYNYDADGDGKLNDVERKTAEEDLSWFAPGLSAQGLLLTIEDINNQLIIFAGERKQPITRIDTSVSQGAKYFKDLVHFKPAAATQMAAAFVQTIQTNDWIQATKKKEN